MRQLFTGIIEELGAVDGLVDQGDAIRLTVRAPLVVGDASLGDSIAVNGVCLTVAARDQETFTADVMRETLDKTALGDLVPGARVNLERATTPTSRLGGHLVQGHVDATGTVAARRPSEHWQVVEVAVPRPLLRYLVPKGSVTVDGISLTVVDVDDDRSVFSVSLIPETLARTTLGNRQPGEAVNLEVDIVAKYVERMVGPLAAGPHDGARA